MNPAMVLAPAAEPVELADMREWLGYDGDDSSNDAMIARTIAAARSYCEEYSGKSLVERTLQLTLDGFPAGGGAVPLPRGPVQSIASVAWLDSAGAEQELAASVWILDTVRDRLALRAGQVWPVALCQPGAVTVTYVAGWPPEEDTSPTDYAGNIPPDLVMAVRYVAAHFYENPDEMVVGRITSPNLLASKNLMRGHRVVPV